MLGGVLPRENICVVPARVVLAIVPPAEVGSCTGDTTGFMAVVAIMGGPKKGVMVIATVLQAPASLLLEDVTVLLMTP
jgi:hypothetical protein